MSKPREFWRVEWTVARDFHRPWDRKEQSRQFATEEGAAAQVDAVLRVAPSHAELLGVYRTTGWSGRLDWDPVDPDSLHRSPQGAAQHQALVAGWQDNPTWTAIEEDTL